MTSRVLLTTHLLMQPRIMFAFFATASHCFFTLQNPGIQAGHILSLPLVELAEKLQEGSLSPESVLYTYMDKALEVTREVNCLRHFIPECEEQLQAVRRQKERGLLYGVPVSIKDHIGYKFLSRLEQEDSVMVKVLKRQGAIPFVLTNVPQSLFNYDCSNSIFGQTVNPLNHKKSPGGSSGGEGALIAGGGSVLGFGTDIGGSIRLPSSFCGLCGLKPTGNRLSRGSLFPGIETAKFWFGVSQLLGVKQLASAHPLPLFPPSAGDIVDPGLEPQVNCYRIPTLVKKTLALALRPLGFLLAFSPQAYRMEFIAAWRKLKLDVVLCPVLGPAFTLGYPGKLFAAVSSTMLYNVLNFPAGVVPVTTVTEADEDELKHYTGHYGDPWDRRLRQVRLPVAVQCVALPWQEELCLRFMKEVETLARARKRRKV
uniref:Amidase domain-containing protein n=1 Tax=Chelydra serpentina TaxID=8475 RepID=A0A8C3SB42_CHESE